MQAILNELLSFLNVELTVLMTAAMSIIELRGAIPVGISFGLSTIHSTALNYIGSMIPVPILLFGIRPVFNYLRKIKLFIGIVEKLTHRSLGKSENIIKYGFLDSLYLLLYLYLGQGFGVEH